ncbi:MAG: hypothetical protein E7071_01625 [Bacteroidales bacterium]|nr:hypothetical protein [Bacteroidales bacterium]
MIRKRIMRVLAFFCLFGSLTSCELVDDWKFDDSEILNRLDSLENRVDIIESQLTQINVDINSITTLVTSIENKIYIEHVNTLQDGGYKITFTNGKEIVVKDGEPGKAPYIGTDGYWWIGDECTNVSAKGQDAPIIGVAEFEGRYYWEQVFEGSRSWLLDAFGNKLPVTGDAGVSPKLKVSTDGYWMISYDNGTSYTEMTDENGMWIKAEGKDGQDGAQGPQGEQGIQGVPGINGDSFFSEVIVEEDCVIFILLDGTELKLQKVNDLPDYISITENMGDSVDFAILGKDGSGFFYEADDDNELYPDRFIACGDSIDNSKVVVNFGENGLIDNILTDEFTLVLGNYENNKFDAVVITKEGASAIQNGIESSINWEEYYNNFEIGESNEYIFVTQINIILKIICQNGGLKELLEKSELAISKDYLENLVVVDSIYNALVDVEVINPTFGTQVSTGDITYYIKITVDRNSGFSIDEIIDIIEEYTKDVAEGGSSMEDDANDDINLGEGSLVSGYGQIKMTLTWDNYSDIDIHCVDPSGYHIYYGAMRSTTGGYLDYDNVNGFGPENIYFDPAPEGTYEVYLHYYAEKNGVSSVRYKVVIFKDGVGETFEGRISGKGTIVPISTFVSGSSSTYTSYSRAASSPNYVIDWNNLPSK